ncbi:hypothetical protein Tco_1128979, partial [Tanacetum coccineum]
VYGGGGKWVMKAVVRRYSRCSFHLEGSSRGYGCEVEVVAVMVKVDLRDFQEEGHPGCSQAKGSKVEERLVYERMKVKFEALIENKKMYYLGLRSCLGGIMVNLIFLKGLEEEALVEFRVELFEEDEDGKKNKNDALFNWKENDQSRKA